MSSRPTSDIPDVTVARLRVDALGARPTTVRPERAAGIAVPAKGPHQPDHHRY